MEHKTPSYMTEDELAGIVKRLTAIAEAEAAGAIVAAHAKHEIDQAGAFVKRRTRRPHLRILLQYAYQ